MAEKQGQDLVISYVLEAVGPVQVDLFGSTDHSKCKALFARSCGFSIRGFSMPPDIPLA